MKRQSPISHSVAAFTLRLAALLACFGCTGTRPNANTNLDSLIAKSIDRPISPSHLNPKRQRHNGEVRVSGTAQTTVKYLQDFDRQD
jgi:hypothetical protein